MHCPPAVGHRCRWRPPAAPCWWCRCMPMPLTCLPCRSERELVLAAVGQAGMALRYASAELRAEPEVGSSLTEARPWMHD